MMRAAAAVLDAPGAQLRQTSVDVEEPAAGEVLVRVRACGVCRSDRHVQMTGEALALPAVLGHEAAGVIEAVGAGVDALVPGDHVLVAWTPTCGRCWFCLRGTPNLCARLQVSTRANRLSEQGKPLQGYMSVAGFSELTVVGQRQAIKIRRDAPLDRVCLIGCGVMTGFGAAVRAGAVRVGDAVAVFGCGAVGLSAIQGASIAGAQSIIAVDVSEHKLTIARRLGASHTVNARTGDPLAAVTDATAGRGADVVIEAVGNPDVLRHAMAATAAGGTTVTVGLTALDAEVRLPPLWLLLDRTLRGSIYGSANPPVDFPRLVEWYMSHRLRLDELVTAIHPLARVNDALDALDDGTSVRGVIVME